MQQFLTVTAIISSREADHHNFQALKEYLSNQGIYVDTHNEELPKDSNCAKATIIAYTEQTTVLSVKNPGLDEIARIFKRPPSVMLTMVGPNINISQLYTDGQIILLKLDEQALEFRFDLPHHFFDLGKGITKDVDKITNIIRSAGIRDTTPQSNKPDQDQLNRRFSEAKLYNDEFPVLDNGAKILPGTKIYGGRGFYYDADGYILDAYRIAQTGRMNDDWAFLCGFLAFEYNGWVEVEGRCDWFNISELATSLISDLLPPKPILAKGASLIKSVDLEVMEYCALHPEGFDHLTPGAFEDLIAAMFRNQGFDVEQLGSWNQSDGGVDILAIRKDTALGEYKVAIQCKHYKKTIMPAIIRELNGTIDKFKASIGVVATTSSFSAKSYDLVKNDFWRIKLQDRNAIIERLKAIFKK